MHVEFPVTVETMSPPCRQTIAHSNSCPLPAVPRRWSQAGSGHACNRWRGIAAIRPAYQHRKMNFRNALASMVQLTTESTVMLAINARATSSSFVIRAILVLYRHHRFPAARIARASVVRSSTAARAQASWRMARPFSRCQSRSFSVPRLSCSFLPLARPMFSFARPWLQCRSSGTMV